MLIELINNIDTNWKDILLKFDYNYIDKFLEDQEKKHKNNLEIYPPKNLIFNCFSFFNFEELNIVILGQDPYIKKGEAMGLSFSVDNNINTPPSLKNIIKELNRSLDLNIDLNKSNLTNWAKQGILLLNSSLTVLQSKSNSHKLIWKKFSEYIIRYISDNNNNIIFILWGNDAIQKENMIDSNKHLILKSGHPSPLNTKNNFIGNNHFVYSNNYLKDHNKSVINWNI